MDTARFLANYTNIITARQIHRIIKENLKDWLHNLVCTAAAGMEEEIKLRKVSFDPIKTSARLDGNSGKVRDIGVECIKQQIYDYVATNGLRELFERKIGTYQCASIPGRGQVYGKTAIENWIRKNPGKTRSPIATAVSSALYPNAPATGATYLNVSPIIPTLVFALDDACASTSAK